MNETLLPRDLSEGARALYQRALKNEGRQLRVDKPVWRHKPDGERELTVEEYPLAHEIAAAGLGAFRQSESYPEHDTLHVVALSPLFTQHVGFEKIYGWDLEVVLVDPEMPDYTPSQKLLLRAEGAYLGRYRSDSRGLEMWRLTVKHPSATDYEHDRCILVDIKLVGLEVNHYGWNGLVEHTGIMTDTRLYPYGEDCLTNPTAEYAGADGPRECEDERCIEVSGGHSFGNFVPPERDELKSLAGRAVRVTLRARPQEDE